MSDDPLLIDLSTNGILYLTMNRPTVHNAFDDLQIDRLLKALTEARYNSDVRVVVIAGNGKSFSSGGDINYMRRMADNTFDENIADAAKLARLMQSLNFLPKPTIARIHGPAMGGGVGLACCCDYAIGSPAAKFALSEVKLGLAPATIAPYVINSIGEKSARQLFMRGVAVPADEALRLGFLYQLVSENELDETINTLALELLQNSPAGIQAAKGLCLDISQDKITADVINRTVTLLANLRDSDEGKEGLKAFLQRRTPNWRH